MSTTSRIIPLSALVIITLSISGCIGNDMGDLQRYIDEVKARQPRAIEPLPKIQQVESYIYESKGRRDPFSSTFGEEEFAEKTVSGGGLRPDPLRRKEELEQFPLDTLRMVGTLKQNDKTWALVKSQDGVIHRVQPGNHAGLNHGQITHIAEQKIELTEIVPDGQGNYQERQAVLSLGGVEEKRTGR